MTEPMTDDDLQRERLLSYFAGYEAGKADAAKETCVGLTEEERDLLSYILADPCQTSWLSHADNETLRKLLARSAQPADTVTVRREVLWTLVYHAKADIDKTLEQFAFDPELLIRDVAEAEAALVKGGE